MEIQISGYATANQSCFGSEELLTTSADEIKEPVPADTNRAISTPNHDSGRVFPLTLRRNKYVAAGQATMNAPFMTIQKADVIE